MCEFDEHHDSEAKVFYLELVKHGFGILILLKK
jgi:hypothetical protein